MAQTSCCPYCLQKGVINPLLTLESSSGKLQNLCADPFCRYPFSSYSALPYSVTLRSAAESTNPAKAAPEIDCSSMEEFLAELWDSKNEVDLDVTSGEPNVKHPQPVKNTSDLQSSNKCSNTRLEFSEKFSDAFDSELGLSPECLPSVPSNVADSYMLPRYLADDIKRAASSYQSNTYRHSSPVPHKSMRDTHKSCDSGISVTSNSTFNSASTTLSEHAAQIRTSMAPISSPTDDFNSDPSYNPPTQSHCPRPVLHVERMIHLYKKRLGSVMN
ncbi:unnamed protein product [Echinostoma caproni]|uniref:Expressed conserved protein n=1 Tax=Echinostoma caproni TaxID=27848 RepID=A0A183BBX4_9TREM|nr:unnamed protein product [Echinostoma caproni]